jgi:thiol-disulfide isomerase/thioredoxin
MINRCVLLVILLTGLIACNEAPKEKQNSSLEVTGELEKLRLTDLNNQPISLTQYEGKTIFINFWATWCKPCIQEMPSIAAAQNILKNENIIFLLASGESAEEIEAFKKNHDYQFNYVRIDNSEEMNIQALPTTFIFNNKALVFSETGARKWDDKNNINLILKIAKQND